MSSNLKPLIMLLVLITLGAGGYYALQRYGVLGLTATSASEVEATTARLEAEVIAELRKSESISFNGNLFTREDFESLTDLSVILPRPRLMRSNPFAPVP